MTRHNCVTILPHKSGRNCGRQMKQTKRAPHITHASTYHVAHSFIVDYLQQYTHFRMITSCASCPVKLSVRPNRVDGLSSCGKIRQVGGGEQGDRLHHATCIQYIYDVVEVYYSGDDAAAVVDDDGVMVCLLKRFIFSIFISIHTKNTTLSLCEWRRETMVFMWLAHELVFSSWYCSGYFFLRRCLRISGLRTDNRTLEQSKSSQPSSGLLCFDVILMIY